LTETLVPMDAFLGAVSAGLGVIVPVGTCRLDAGQAVDWEGGTETDTWNVVMLMSKLFGLVNVTGNVRATLGYSVGVWPTVTPNVFAQLPLPLLGSTQLSFPPLPLPPFPFPLAAGART
jgi:hypothetical protein